MEVLKLFAPYGPTWLGGAALVLIAFHFGNQFLSEYKLQNERKASLDIKREERKQAEVDERAQRDRERSQMEGRIAAQMERHFQSRQIGCHTYAGRVSNAGARVVEQ